LQLTDSQLTDISVGVKINLDHTSVCSVVSPSFAHVQWHFQVLGRRRGKAGMEKSANENENRN